ncbi:MAG: DUF423 domain-containing protein [Cryomorphaceae bacterium]|nr:DUF423 domain-containing protein [Cryomorphaceae bacterium]
MTSIRIGIVLAAIGVTLGALGAHALANVLEAQALSSYLTAVRYQMYHAFALILLGIYGRQTKEMPKAPLVLITTGVLLFSGSIYGLTLLPLVDISARWLGPITPIGGLLLILGWLTWLWTTFKKNSTLDD